MTTRVTDERAAEAAQRIVVGAYDESSVGFEKDAVLVASAYIAARAREAELTRDEARENAIQLMWQRDCANDRCEAAEAHAEAMRAELDHAHSLNIDQASALGEAEDLLAELWPNNPPEKIEAMRKQLTDRIMKMPRPTAKDDPGNE